MSIDLEAAGEMGMDSWMDVTSDGASFFRRITVYSSQSQDKLYPLARLSSYKSHVPRLAQRENTLFHRAIFNPMDHFKNSLGNHTYDHDNRSRQSKVEAAFSRSMGDGVIILAGGDRVSGSGIIEVEFSWGGSDKPSYEVSAKAEVRDESGLNATVKGTHDSDGNKNINASVGYEPTNSSSSTSTENSKSK